MQAKQSLNPIPKTLREKKRYILFRVISDSSFDVNPVARAINNTFLTLFGSFGVAKINPKLVYWDRKTGTGILKCERASKDKAISALQFVKAIDSTTVAISTLSVSGTIKTLRDKLNAHSSDFA